MERIKLLVRHMPWYHQEIPYRTEPDNQKWTYQGLKLYIFSLFAADGFNFIHCGLNEIFRRAKMLRLRDNNDLEICANALSEVLNRPPGYGDEYVIKPTGETPEIAEITFAKPLFLQVSKGQWQQSHYFYLNASQLVTLSDQANARSYDSLLFMLLYLKSRMYHRTIGRFEGYVTTLDYGTICNDLGISKKTAISQISQLEEMQLIGKISGNNNANIYSCPLDKNLMMCYNRAKENSTLCEKKYGGIC